MVRLAIAVAVVTVACYAPAPRAGSPCPDGRCPAGLVCSAATETCERVDRDAGVDGEEDAPVVMIDAPDAFATDAFGCYGTGLVMICPSVTIAGNRLIGTPTTIDTTTSSECIPYTGNQGGLCVIAATSFTITSTLTATGSLPLVVLATDTLQITGAIDVSSRRNPLVVGAGADPAACVASEPPMGDDGGAGGSFGGPGGRGGEGETGHNGSNPAPAVSAITSVRGGCRGGTALGGGAGGRGGGAIYLIAGTVIQLTGTINASGAGGRPGTSNDGGGGGGSGGMIGLDAPTIQILSLASVFANGGGGAASDGQGPGEDPMAPIVEALGGSDRGESGSAPGGNGSAGASTAGRDGGNESDGGGGGGGGAGVIKVFPPQSLGGTVSPAPS